MMPAIKAHHTETSEKAWSGPANRKNLKSGETRAYYSKTFAWRDPDKNDDTKDAYRFIHHEVAKNGTPGAANIKGCQSAIGVLNGARGGTTIPDSDRAGVYKHLATHLEDADVEPPELKTDLEPRKETKLFKLDVKEVTEEGTFEGLLSAYDVVDGGGDVVERGAYTKTLKETGGRVPLLWSHQSTQLPLGTLEVEDRQDGLWVKGKFVLEVQNAKDVYTFVKAGVVSGLSIGYQTVKAEVKNGVRHLKELKLFEGSLCLFPMLETARVTDVKAQDEKADDFNAIYARIRLISARNQMIGALWDTLDFIIWDWDNELDNEEKISLSDQSIQQFHVAYIELLPKLFETTQKAEAFELLMKDSSSGPRISERTRMQIKGAIAYLGSFLGDEAVISTPDEAGSTGKPAATTTDGAADTSEDKASLLTGLKEQFQKTG
jgi:HK97 family phage prohead protease